MTVLLLVVGLVLLVAGGELLVRGATGLARAIGLSPLVVGLTVVSFATSTPELAVTLGATLAGSPGLAVGNVVGSNIANVLLVVGASALVLPLVARAQLVRSDVPAMVGLSLLTLLLALDGSVGRWDGLVLLVLLLVYIVRLVWLARRPRRPVAVTSGDGAAGGPTDRTRPDASPGGSSAGARRVVLDLVLLGGGIGLLVLGSRVLVDSATGLARTFGVSDLVIGLTVVAIGTSLPELVTSLVAALRGQRDLAIGNVVGSNLFNLGSVLGLTALVSPGGVPVTAGAIGLDLPVMVVVAFALLPVAFTGARIERWEGALFLGYYVTYVTYVVLDQTGHDQLGLLSGVVLWFLGPLTAVTLLVLVGHEVRARRRRKVRGTPAPD